MSRRLLPVFLATVVALLHLGLIVHAALSHTQGNFTYAVDDAYIHLAIARHVAFDGVYGVTRFAFSASSSSVVWPWLLAGAMRLFGDHVTLPLLLNVAAMIALIAVIGSALQREAPSLGVLPRTVVLVAVVLLVPVATLAMIGMEHMLHAVLTIAFVIEASRVLSAEQKKSWPLLVLAGALLATRFEGVFPVGIVVVLLAARRRFGLAAALAMAGAAPVLLSGLYAMAHGSLFLPNSIALKRQHLKIEALSDVGDLLGGNVIQAIALQSYLLPLAFGTSLLFVREVRRDGVWSKDAIRLLLAFGTTVAHAELASLGWFYRYEAYLVALDVTVIAIAMAPRDAPFSVREAWRQSRLGFLGSVVTVVVGLAPLSIRALAAQGQTPMASRNIYEQQVQSARFLARYFPRDVVAVNDIGAVAYFGDGPLVDLEGLADLAVAKAKSFQLDLPLDTAQLASFTKDAPIAIVYDEWFPDVPTTWVRLGRLKIEGNKVCASALVSIYATSGESVPRLLTALRDFDASLPKDVGREGRWVETPPQEPSRWRADTGDSLSLEVPGAPASSRVLWVDDDGFVLIPKIGKVAVRGLSLAEVNDAARAQIKAAGACPAGSEPSLALVKERDCRVTVAGNVVRAGERWVDCGTSAARVLQAAGPRRADAGDPYVWREEGGALRRIELGGDPASDATALRGGDIVIVR